MRRDNIVTVSCQAVPPSSLAKSLESDVLPDLSDNFLAVAVVKEAARRLKKLDCPKGITGRRAYDQQR